MTSPDDKDIPPWITDRIGNEELKGVDTQIKSRYPTSAPRAGDQIYTLQGYHIRETEKAVLFEVRQINGAPWDPETGADDYRKRQHWFPLSQVKSITHVNTAGESAIEYDNMQVKEWILSTKGII